MNKVAVVIPNWNGEDVIGACLDSLKKQSRAHAVVVVENGSVDGSLALIEKSYPEVKLLPQEKNLGFAGGVNAGIAYALSQGFEYIALLNNDAVANEHWLKELVVVAEKDKKVGAVMSKIISSDKSFLDGTGEIYTSWGVHFPRGRGEKPGAQYDDAPDLFGASGGASLFRAAMFKDVGLFDEDFFAYYEDIDLAWRMQLRDWKVKFAPKAEVYHEISHTGGSIKGFTVYQTFKNLPWVVWKNIPARLLLTIFPRFLLVYTSFLISALFKGKILYALKGILVSLLLLPKKLIQRRRIQKGRVVSISYLRSIILWSLPPPHQEKLRRLRKLFTGR